MAEDDLPGEEIHPDDPRWQKAERKARAKANGHAEEIAPHQLSDITKDIVQRQWIVDSYLPANNVSLLSGEGAIGKSILAQQLEVVIALNAISDHDHDWLGLLPKGGPVLNVTCEEDEDEFNRRLELICQHYGTTRKAISKYFHTMSWVDADTTQLMVLDRKTDTLKATLNTAAVDGGAAQTQADRARHGRGSVWR